LSAAKRLEFRTPKMRVLAGVLGWSALVFVLGSAWACTLAAMIVWTPIPSEVRVHAILMAVLIVFGPLALGYLGWCCLDSVTRLVDDTPVLTVDGRAITVYPGSLREVRVPWSEVAFLDSLRFAPRRYSHCYNYTPDGVRIVLRKDARCVGAFRKMALDLGGWFGMQGLIVGANELSVPVETFFEQLSEYRQPAAAE
jgi:hypothetical protein